METSNTVYVGNLSFYSTEDSLYELFSRCGSIADIKIGINDVGHPCGFCFVMYYNPNSDLSTMSLQPRLLNSSREPSYVIGSSE